MSKKIYNVQTTTIAARSRNGSLNGNSYGSSGGNSVDLAGIYSALNLKLDTEIFDDFFEKVNIGDEENPEYAIRAKYGLFSNDWISSRGINLNIPPVGVEGKSNLSELLDVSLGALADGESLVWDASQKKWVNRKLQGGTGGLNETELGKYLEDKKYATQQWVTEQGFLKSHQNIFAATFEPGQFSEKTYTPNLAAATVKIPTNTSHLVNDSGFIVSSMLDNYVKKTGDTMTGNLTFGSMLNPLSFSRNSYNYINANTEGGSIAFIVNGKAIGMANASLIIKDTSVIPGNVNVYSLGDGYYRWSNIYSVLGNFSYSLTIGKATLTWDESEQALKIDTGFYSDVWISSRGLNKGIEGSSGFGQLLTIQRNGVKIGEYNGSTAQTINIAVPTNTSELTNGAGFITSAALNGYAKEDWVQGQLSALDLSGYLKLSGGTMTGNIKFSQQYAYIDSTFDNGSSYGTLCFRIHDFTNSLSSLLRLRIDADGNKVVDGGTNGSTSLGATSFRWGTIYSVLGDFSGLITANGGITIPTGKKLTIGDIEITWDSEIQGLKFSKGVYSEEWISSRGLNPGVEGGGISEDFLKNYLTDNNYAKKSDIPSLTGYATETWVQTQIANIKLTDYLSLSGGTMRNTNLVTNMNADLLDGLHSTSFMRYLGSPVDIENADLYHGCGYTMASGGISSYNGPFLGFGVPNYFKVLWGRYSTNSLFLRTYNNGEWLDSRELAFTDSNVASANQLLYSRNIWGQPFNGTADVKGSLSDVTDINMTGILYIGNESSNSSIRFSRPGVSYFYATTEGGSFAFITSGKSYAAANADLRITSGMVYPGTNNVTDLGGSSYRWSQLYSVLGNFSGAVTMTSTLNVSGLITAQNGIKIGDGTITWDYTANAFRFSHALYSEFWISSRGLNNSTSGGNGVIGDFLPLSGGTLTGPLNFNITSATAQITFARASYNYIRCASTGGALAFVTNGLSNSIANASLAIGVEGIFPGVSNAYSLGLAAQRWTTLYVNTINVTSNALVNNLNAEMLDGHTASDFVSSSVLSGYVTGSQLSSAISTLASQSWVNTQLSSYLLLGGGTLIGTVTTTSTHTPFIFNYNGGNYNYIQCATSLAFIAAGKNSAITNATLVVRTDGITPGNGTYNCGSTSYRWNAIYGVTGNFSSAVTQNTSDLRLKTDIESVDCLEILCKVGNVFSFRYNSEAVEDRPWLDTTTLHYGLAYQNAVRANIPGFTGKDDYGYGWLNFLSSDMLALLTGGVLELYLQQREIKNDVNSLRYRVSRLEDENKTLKERLKELEAA